MINLLAQLTIYFLFLLKLIIIFFNLLCIFRSLYLFLGFACIFGFLLFFFTILILFAGPYRKPPRRVGTLDKYCCYYLLYYRLINCLEFYIYLFSLRFGSFRLAISFIVIEDHFINFIFNAKFGHYICHSCYTLRMLYIKSNLTKALQHFFSEALRTMIYTNYLSVTSSRYVKQIAHKSGQCV